LPAAEGTPPRESVRAPRWVELAASLGGAGFSRYLPGTVGTAVAFLPVPFLPASLYPWALLIGCVLATFGSAWLAGYLPGQGRAKDPGWFVLDEAAGIWLACFHLHRPNFAVLIATFVLFRLFDMTKPPPLRRLEKTGGTFGIVLDDLGAGVYAWALVTAATSYWWK
jgi:phosphatidylglycerophosphatase A